LCCAIDVICDKPLTVSLAEGKKMKAAVDKVRQYRFIWIHQRKNWTIAVACLWGPPLCLALAAPSLMNGPRARGWRSCSSSRSARSAAVFAEASSGRYGRTSRARATRGAGAPNVG